MKQTSVEWLFNQLWNSIKDKFTWYALLNKAKEMEKEKILNAYKKGFSEGVCFGASPEYKYITSEQYYNETYENISETSNS